jgi:hypothetical protein
MSILSSVTLIARGSGWRYHFASGSGRSGIAIAGKPAIDSSGQQGAYDRAIQNNHSWEIAQSPWKMATSVLRAGFTEVLVTGILIK